MDDAALADGLPALLAQYPDLLKAALARIDHKPIVRSIVGSPLRVLPVMRPQPPIADEYRECGLAASALQRLIERYSFDTVLDVGSGAGRHARVLAAHGKTVTKMDFGVSVYFKKETDGSTTIVGDVNEIELDQTFDCVWASHVLEHQRNPGRFLEKLKRCLAPDGLLCVTVPPAKLELVGGHVSLWTPGHLAYHLVLAGFDCSRAEIFQHGYNISAFVRNSTIELPPLHYDTGDIGRLRPYLPRGFNESMDSSRATTE
ncbi:hypothetical protein Rmf_19300 [Roseomonas fluvialis]|uniref:Methyltransferase type 11 domain-containing protein n=2 Tax=Roseomonas fluvialis TaxID=1750527 RepID=A0ABM7Y2H7_9PROT|nr:hypothetical protein Rmf_19300 [Roseomonas fluvialis]